jgi:FixJ family two-component response regulator
MTRAPSPVVFVVDDDASFRVSLSRLLGAAGYTVAPFASAEKYIEQHDPHVPGCLVLDFAMPGLNGLELQDTLADRGGERPIIFLTGKGDIPTSVQAMKHGAVDFLTKTADEDTLLAAIDTALQKDAALRQDRSGVNEFKRRWGTLTPRERDVAQHVMAGRLNKQIAGDLGTALRTVKFHRGHVMSKLKVGSVAELARLVERAGLAGR